MQFNQVIGQERAKNILLETVTDNRVSHAQLFVGPKGSGKLPLALAYAQYIMCQDKNGTDSCGVCPGCVKVAKLIHPDLHFVFPMSKTPKFKRGVSTEAMVEFREFLLENQGYIDGDEWFNYLEMDNKQGTINVEECNEIIKKLSLKTYESEYKIMIIWMIDKIYHSAAPKLLKILEEPPEKTLFILITDDADSLLPTIKSRTQLITLQRVSDKALTDFLQSTYHLNQAEAFRIINLADGNVTEARKRAGQEDEEGSHFILFRDWMRLCYAMDVFKLEGIIKEFSSLGREKQKNFLSYALRIIRFCLLHNYGNGQHIRLDGEEKIFVERFSAFIKENNILEFTKELEDSIYHIERNAKPNILFTDMSFKFNQWLKRNR